VSELSGSLAMIATKQTNKQHPLLARARGIGVLSLLNLFGGLYNPLIIQIVRRKKKREIIFFCFLFFVF
jgi:hypothetical protein